MENKNICQCCGMPLDKNTYSHELDGTVNDHYCKWCFHDGKFEYQSIDQLIDACIPHMVKQGFNEELAREYMSSLLPNLDYWKN